jgi:hypothetical protein
MKTCMQRSRCSIRDPQRGARRRSELKLLLIPLADVARLSRRRIDIATVGVKGRFEISCQAPSSSSSALASFRSRVSKPSVNQP